MKIKALTKFKHGVDTFEQDDIRTIANDLANYFVSQGWAKDETGQLAEPFVGDIDLTIHNGKIGLEDTNG
jgi:hypothetical protein